MMQKQAKGLAVAKNTICLWYDKDAEAAARFTPRSFPVARWVPSTVHPVITRPARKATC